MSNIYSTKAFETNFTYKGNDLGAVWTKEKTVFKVWAPTAASVKVNLYRGGTPYYDDFLEQIEMSSDVNGTWVAEKYGDLNGIYYTYIVDVNGSVREACDPYAVAAGVNGKRAMVIDLDSTNPMGWDDDRDPHYEDNITDAVIYELHVRDLSMDDSSGIRNKGKYLGLVETGTKNSNGIPTGLDHIKDLGVTHVHLLPVYDFGSVDERCSDMPQFNWGYDPLNYNVPEGSYSTDAFSGAVRIAEMKQMVKGFHDNGISVIMDVVYNHVYSADSFCFNHIVPGYFSRINDRCLYSNGSGCGNDTASERAMVRKYIVDSVFYWTKEYHIDGFRFDLVGLIDIRTIKEVIKRVHKVYPNVIFYGEGWSIPSKLTKRGYTMTTQQNADKVPKFAFFSDTIRDGLRGNVFNNSEKGYVSGAEGYEETISRCFMGAPYWCDNPTQIINYASCHDNMTLFDRLTVSTPDATAAERIKMNKLAAAIYMTSQGVPFFQAGEEMLRSKKLPNGEFDHNSYRSPDSVNSIKWDDLNSEEYMAVYEYYKGLLAFRRAHPSLRMTNAEDISRSIERVWNLPRDVLAFRIKEENERELFVVFNPKTEDVTIELPLGQWTVFVNGEKAGVSPIGTASGKVTVDAISAFVLEKL